MRTLSKLRATVAAGVIAIGLSACVSPAEFETDPFWAAFPAIEPLPQAAPAELGSDDGTVHVSWAAGHLKSDMIEVRKTSDVVVVVTPTGERTTVAVEQPAGAQSPIHLDIAEYVVVRPAGKGGNQVKQGELIWILEPLPETRTLPNSGYSMVFLYEFVYWLGDSKPQDGRKVFGLTGGFQGLWIDRVGNGVAFEKTDHESPGFPDSINESDGQ